MLLGHFGDAVHVVASDLLRHHAAHGQLQLQEGRSKAVVLGNKRLEMSEVTWDTSRPADWC